MIGGNGLTFKVTVPEFNSRRKQQKNYLVIMGDDMRRVTLPSLLFSNNEHEIDLQLHGVANCRVDGRLYINMYSESAHYRHWHRSSARAAMI